MRNLRGSKYLLDGYVTHGIAKKISIGGSKYILQHFQGEHKDEYIMKKDNMVYLFHNGIVRMIYQEDAYGSQNGDFTRFENGCVSFIQSFDDIWSKRDFYRIVNHVKGERLEIYSNESGKLMYHGEFNRFREREGWGVQYDEKSGVMLLEGIWKGNKLVEIIRKIEGSIMIEFKRNGNNTIASNRIPTYVGEFDYDESKELFIRNGRGYLIDEETRIATREVEWKDGVEVSGRELYAGWYTRSTAPKPKPRAASVSKNRPLLKPIPQNKPVVTPIKINVKSFTDLKQTNIRVTDLIISSNCCNDLNALDLNRFKCLRSIEIGDDCFESVKTFKIDGLNQLKRLIVGINSFTRKKDDGGNDKSKSFHIVNCESMKSIQIGEYSFSDFAGEFELKNLPQLQSIQFGTMGKGSDNFYYCSFVVRGNDMELV